MWATRLIADTRTEQLLDASVARSTRAQLCVRSVNSTTDTPRRALSHAGQKLLRSGLVGCPEWQSAEVREETAREALRHGHPTLADALRAKDSAKLRKRQYIWLCRRWGYASWVWQHKDTEGFARQARGVSARATAPGAGSSAQVTPLRRSLSHKTITVMDDGEEQPRGSSRRRLSSRQPSTGGVHTSPEMQLPPPSRALGVANQELHPSLRHLLVQHARTHVPTQGVRMLELAAVSCDSGMPMILPRVSMLRSYLPMLLRFRRECDLDMHAIAAQRERLDPAALASAQVWMHNCNIWQRANERLNLLDDAVVKPVVAASASIRDIMVFNSLDRAYVAACGYDTEHIARFLTLAKSTLAYARAQSRGEFLATAQWVSECLRMLLDSLLTVVELRLQFLNARTVTIAYPPQAEKNTGGAPMCPSPALSPGLATALVCAKCLEENMALANVEALDTDTQEVITQWKGIVTVVVSDLTAGREPSGRGNMFEED